MEESCTELRKMLFRKSKISFLIGIENRQGIFPIHKSFKFTLLSAEKNDQEKDYEFKIGFFKGSRPKNLKNVVLNAETIFENCFAPKTEEMENLLPLVLERGLKISKKLVEIFSPDTLSIMEFGKQKDIDLARKIYDDYPLILDELPFASWKLNLLSEELNATRCKRLTNSTKGLPVLKGENMWQYCVDSSDINEFIEENIAREFLKSREIKRLKKNLRGMDSSFNISDSIHYHYEFYRIGFRLISSSTNERTLISSIIPKKHLVVNSIPTNIPYEYTYSKNKIDTRLSIKTDELLFSVGILNSFVLDYICRQKTSESLNLFQVYTLPIPRLTSGNWFFDQIVPRAARLICIDEEFAELWEETFKPEWREIAKTSKVKGWENLTEKWTPECGVYGWVYINNEKRDDGDRAQLRAEIDALVAHLYGLTKDEFAYILDTFPVLRRKEEEAFGEFRTKRMCLEEYDRFTAIIEEEKKKYPEKFDLSRFKKSYVESGKKPAFQATFTKDGKLAKMKTLDSFTD